MGAITGSSVATVAALGGTVGKEMAGRGRPAEYTAALNASAGLLGILIPPLILLILYGSIVGVSITQFFPASVGPGLLLTMAFIMVHSAIARCVFPGGRESLVTVSDGGAQIGSARSAARKSSVLKRSIPALLLPVLVLGGIYSGVFTPTEATTVAGVYALLVIVLGKMTKVSELGGIFYRASLSAAAILLIIAFTSIFNRAMVLEQIPQAIATYATTFTTSPPAFLLVVNLVLLLIGMFMETNAATLLMGPLLAPAAASFGIDPVHFAIVLVTNIELGLLTPPMAANLYLAARTVGADIVSLLRQLGWFFFAAALVIAIITYVPQLSLWYRIFS